MNRTLIKNQSLILLKKYVFNLDYDDIEINNFYIKDMFINLIIH